MGISDYLRGRAQNSDPLFYVKHYRKEQPTGRKTIISELELTEKELNKLSDQLAAMAAASAQARITQNMAIGYTTPASPSWNAAMLQQLNNLSINQPSKGTIPMPATKFNVGDEVTATQSDFTGAVFRIDDYSSPYYICSLIDYGTSSMANSGYALGQGYNFEAKYLQAAPAKTHVNFDSVIISDEKRQQILEAIEQIGKEKLIFEDWGFKETIEKGRGVGMLFYGEPGTGKTLMAQAIANKLGYRLKLISSADVQSSAPGQTERNIRQHFADAKKEGSKTILLFDECDSLIYSRANVGAITGSQINELLSQIERFTGITIFTTNRLGLLDEAVDRRLALKLEFSMPTLDERIQIWKRMIPPKAPLDKDVELEKLAGVELAGGYIKNAVLRAARMAALGDKPDKDKKITMSHFRKALRQEAEAMIAFKEAQKEFNETGRQKYGAAHAQ